MFDLAARRKLNRGEEDGFARAVEIVVTPLLFGFLGHLADGWLGTRPTFTIGLAAFGVIGLFFKLWVGYDREMQAEQAAVPTARGIVVTPAPIDADPGIVVPRGWADDDNADGDADDEGTP